MSDGKIFGVYSYYDFCDTFGFAFYFFDDYSSALF